jgi:hypothetical protein
MELFDVRAKVPLDTHLALQAHAQATGKEIGEILREITIAWGEQRIHEARLLSQGLEREGLAGRGGERGGSR